MNESVLVVIGSMSFIPPLLLAGDLLELVLKKRPEPMRSSVPPMQIWLQDFFVLATAFAVVMACFFDPQHAETAVMPVVSIVMGFAASVDVTSGYANRSGIARAIVFIATLAAFSMCPWLAAILWFLWNRLRARLLSCFFIDKAARNCAAISVVIYSIAFALPMTRSIPLKSEMMGWTAYLACFGGFFSDKGDSLGNMAWAWMANPCFWIATVFLLQGRRLLSAIFALGALGLALTINDPLDYSLPRSVAYLVWSSSMLLLAIFALVLAVKDFRAKQTRAIV